MTIKEMVGQSRSNEQLRNILLKSAGKESKVGKRKALLEFTLDQLPRSSNLKGEHDEG